MLRIEDRDRVRLLTLARPEVLNALDTRLWNALADALTGAAESPHVRAAVLTGQGRAFCAGQDLAEMSRLSEQGAAGAGREVVQDHGFARCMDALVAFDKPLLAAVNGIAVGFGLTVLAHCDIVLIAQGARLRAPFVSLGVVPEAASSYLLPEIMGWQAAAHALFTGGWIECEQAVDAGLAWRCCHPEHLVPETMALAAEIAGHSLEALVATKRLMKAGRLEAIVASRRREDEAFGHLTGAPANRQALDAFLGRR